MDSRTESALWVQWSGLPEVLNGVRANGWLVFKTLMEMDCRRHRTPEAVECSLGELAEVTGLEWERVAKILEALQKKKYLACFIPDNPDEEGLFQIRVPLKTPKGPEQVALEAREPTLRDASGFRYVSEPEDVGAREEKTQKIIDLYLNKLSQRVNSFIVDQIEVLVQRFPLEAIERTMERAARHEIRSLGWVVKELVRDAKKPARGERIEADEPQVDPANY